MAFWHWLSRRNREEEELDEELRFHLQQEEQLRRDRGESPDSARSSTRRDFGNVTRAREATREMWGWAAWERAAQDVRFASRTMRKNLSFTLLAVTALALGIGATSAIFTVVHSVLLRPLRFQEPDRLVMVWERPPQGKLTNVVQTQNFLVWRQRNRCFDDIAAMGIFPTNLDGDGDAVQVPGMRVTAGFFPILGVKPEVGRMFSEQDDVPNAPLTMVLSYGLWQRRFGGRRDLVGSKVRLGSGSAEVIGVMPESFEFPAMQHVELYLPMQFNTDLKQQDGRNYTTVARLKRGVSFAAAQEEMRAIASRTAQERPDFNTGWSTTMVPLMEQTVGDTRATMLVLLGAVAFVLLIACANVANLLLMRASSRRREMTVRAALGAGRWRLIHQLMVESVMLAALGGVLGLLLASWGVPAILKSLPQSFPLPRMAEISVDRTVMAFTLAISVLCGVVFGIVPALQVNRGKISEGLRQGGRGASGGNRGVRHSLVVAEIGLAMLLVVGAGLMVRSFILLNSVNPGFRPDHLLTFRMMLLSRGANIDEYLIRRADLLTGMLQRIRALPMVQSASSIHLLPMTGMQSGSGYYRLDRPAPPPGSLVGGDVSVISDRYFETMGIRMMSGREFDSRDRVGSPLVAVLNQTAATQQFPGESPIGKRMRVFWQRIGKGPDEVEIVGVASDIRHSGLNLTPDPCIFLPHSQQPSGYASLVIRTHGDPHGAIAAVKGEIRATSSNQGTQDIETMDQVLGDSVAKPRLEVAVLGVFGAVALLLACVGIYAVISYSVEQRTREMGIRLALGAAPRAILRMVLREGLWLAVIGIASGVAAALILTRYLQTLLFAIKPTDPLVFGSVAAILAAAAAAGCYFPARRATRVDPAVVLREE